MKGRTPGDEIVCHCGSVDRKTLENAIRAGAGTLSEIRLATGACAGGDCERLNPKGICCCEDILALIEKIAPSRP